MEYILLSLGIFMFGAIAVWNQIGGRKFRVFSFLMLFTIFSFLTLGFLVANSFTGQGVDQSVIYHAFLSMEGAGIGDFMHIIIPAIIATFILITLIILAYKYFIKKAQRPKKIYYHFGVGAMFLAVFVNLLSNQLSWYYVSSAKENLGFNFINKSEESYQFKDYYREASLEWKGLEVSTELGLEAEIEPKSELKNEEETATKSKDFEDLPITEESKTVEIPKNSQNTQSSEKLNLVYIYAESFERTYFDEEKFPGLITELRQFEDQAIDFTNIVQVDFTGWTVAGMTASQCGLPLFNFSGNNSMNGVDDFLPAAKCLGDLLRAEGYYLAYLGGADLDFAGKGNLYFSHGFDSVKGKAILSEDLEDPDYLSKWGVYDDTLFNKAKEDFLELSENSLNLDLTNKENQVTDPFGMVVLTLDTHNPQGHISQTCKNLEIQYQKGNNEMLDAVACADYLLADFIKFIQDSEYSENTLIVLTSDHLAMKNGAWNLLNRPKEERRNLFWILDPNSEKGLKVESLGSTLDIGVTFLDFLGYQAEIGLGRNLLKENSLVSQISNFDQVVFSWRDELYQFWEFPDLTEGLSLNLEKNRVEIGGKNIRIPVLIRLKDNLEAYFAFDFYDGWASLNFQLEESLGKGPLIWIDECWQMEGYLSEELSGDLRGNIGEDVDEDVDGNVGEKEILVSEKTLNSNENSSEKYCLQLYNLEGNLVREEVLENDLEINPEELEDLL